MRVLLIAYDNESYIHRFPQGLAYIAAALRNAGHDIMIYHQDIHHWPEEHLTAYLDNNNFDVVGLGVIAGYYQYQKLKAISAAVNSSKNRGNFKYVVGGHGPSPEPKFFLRKTLADIAVLGEGDETIVDLLSNLGELDKVLGIAYRDGFDIAINDRRPLIEDVDSIAMPAYDLFPMEHYRLFLRPNSKPTDFAIPVLSARGCKFKCNFCYRMDKGYRPRSPKSILGEISYLQENYGITYIDFSDELLMASVDRATELCKAFLEHPKPFRWCCNGRLNFATKNVLDLMKCSGCVFINYGVESLDNNVLKRMGKALTKDIIIRGVEATLDSGISPGLNIIFGSYGDNEETLDESVKFLRRYSDGSQLRTIRPVTPYPGSPLYYDAIRDGKLDGPEDFYENKHVNSDLLTVNFTEMSDENLHHELCVANSILAKSYYDFKTAIAIDSARQLYRGDSSFRGYRTV